MSVANTARQPHQAWGVAGCAGAVLLAIVAQGYIVEQQFPLDGLLLYSVALAIAYRSIPHIDRAPAEDAPAFAPRALRFGRAFLLVASVEGFSWLLAMASFRTNSNLTPAWSLYLGSIAGAPIAVWMATGQPRWRASPGFSAGYLTALTLVLIVAAALRFASLDTLPFGLWWDEAARGIEMQKLLADPASRQIYVAGLLHEPALIWYIKLPLYEWLGPTAFALRATAAVGGLLGVVAVYLLGGELYGRRVGIIAAALLAVMSWHINFSRIAFSAPWSVALNALSAYLFLRAMRTGSAVHFALAGTMLGLSLNLYYSSRLIPVIFLIYLAHRLVVVRAQFFRRHLGSLIIFALVLAVTAGPMVQFSFQNPAEFSTRIDQVSILREVTDQGSLQPLMENLRKHALMFNYQGDGNGRHNLPHAPMLEQFMGGLFILGLLLALRRGYKASNFFLLVWTVVMISGGVFSLAFEAPQGLRTVDETVAVALLAALPITGLWESLGWIWRGEFRIIPPANWRWRTSVSLPVAAVPIIVLLGMIGYSNYDRYFVRQASDGESWAAFSTPETLIGQQINALGPGYAVYLGPTFIGHPTIKFLTGRGDFPPFDPAANLPLRDSSGVAIFLEPHQSDALAALRQLYPEAGVTGFAPPAGGSPVLYSVVVPQPQVLRLQGMAGSYYSNESWAGAKVTEERLPTSVADLSSQGLPPMPFSANWEASIFAPSFGSYRFKLEGPPTAVLTLDGTAQGKAGETRELSLAKGSHTIKISAVVRDSTAVRLLWQPPGTAHLDPIGRGALFLPDVSNHGLLGSYYGNREWSGSAALQQIDPYIGRVIHLLPLSRPYTVEWKGKIDAPRSGSYRFATDSADSSWVYLDGRLVVSNEGANRQMKEASVTLDEGFHDIGIRFLDQSGYTYLKVFWTPPGGERAVLPTERLYPPQGSYPPHLRESNPPPPPSVPAVASTALPAPLKAGSVRLEFVRSFGGGSAGLGEPRDVAVATDGTVYVADSASKKVVRLDPSGKPAGQLEGSFVEPFGVAIGPEGSIFVLDSLGQDSLLRFSSAGAVEARLGAGIGMYSPRGLAIDAAGSIYVADTGRGRVVKLSREGQLQGEFHAGGQLAQPVSVAVGRDGSLYVIDGETARLSVIDAGDHLLRSWSVAQSTTFDAPHLAIGSSGEVYVTDPNGAAIEIYDGFGTSLGKVGARGNGDAQLELPTGLRSDGRGGIWVADTRNHRIQQWVVK